MSKVEMYTTGSCVWCLAAKNLLKQRGFGYEEIRIDQDPARYEEMLARAQRRSVPQIFIDGEWIGGYQELVEADRAGRLAQPRGDAA